MSDAVYFIDPSNQESIWLLVKDFVPDEEDHIDFDQYGDVHICFSSPFDSQETKDFVYKTILSQKKLVKKMKTLIECNIDFNIWQDNVFWLETPQQLSLTDIHFFNKKQKDSLVMVEMITSKLLTLCSVLNEKPYI